MADDFGADFDKLLVQTGRRPRLRRFGVANVRMKSQDEQLILPLTTNRGFMRNASPVPIERR